MAKNYFNRYIWLIDIVSRHGHISREEISELWSRSHLNETGEGYLPERTFHNHIDSIYDTFGIEIKCDRSLGYYIANSNDIDGDNIKHWLLQSLSLNNILNESSDMRDNILFEHVPSSQKHLITIVESIRDRKIIEITYQGFNKSNASKFEASPYCLKLFKQRWYVVAQTPADSDPWVYGLDRILDIKRTNRSYRIPKSFNAQDYFRNLYGVCIEDWKCAEDVEIKVDKSQVNYFRSLQLHPSQTEIETTDDFSIFRYHIVPTYDFTQELLSKSDSIEVLLPIWYRDEIKGTIRRMLTRYDE